MIEPPNEVEAPAIVIAELLNFALAIEPANIAFVTPLAFTLNVSELISIEESSTLTAKETEPESPPPVKPSPAVTPSISPLENERLFCI